MSKKTVLFSGFMLFSLFFGAGNLIFPPILGFESGSNFAPAIIGFLITAVLLPFLAIMAVALSDNGLISIGNRVNKIFGLVFAIIIYMSIGAFYGIPRASNVAYELGLGQITATEGWGTLFVFSIIFFGATYVISYNPNKIVDRIGQILTPILLLVLAILFIQSFLKFDNQPSNAISTYETAPFLNGFLEGYFTMDAVAALAFGIVVINGLISKGATTRLELIKGSIGAAVLAGIALMIVYFSLGWIGKVIPSDVAYTNGAEILTAASQQLFVRGGSLLFGVIVMLACLTTCVGLINACSQFFNSIYPKLSYQAYVGVFVLIGLLVSNLGLDLILQLALPLLVFIYPIAIVLILLSIFQQMAGGDKFMYQLSVAITSVYAIYDVLISLNINVSVFKNILSIAPFFNEGLGWIVPAVIAAMIGYVLDMFNNNKHIA